MATTTWSFGSAGSSFYATVSFDGSSFTINCIEGRFDLNALWFSDGDAVSGEGGATLPKADSSLDMGSTKVKWDDYAKFSDSGLKKGQNLGDKSTYFTAGETQVYSLSQLQSWGLNTSWITDWSKITLGMRATSVSGVAGTTSIKYTSTPSAPPPPDTTAPAVLSVSDNVAGTVNQNTSSVVYTYTFSESVTGLAADDFNVTNGTISSVNGSGNTWTVTVTPTAGVASGNISLVLASGAVSDAAGNSNTSSHTENSQLIDTAAPNAPSIDVLAASDTGSSDTDNISSDTTPDVEISLSGTNADAGDVVKLYSGATVVGTYVLQAGDISAGKTTITASSLGSDGVKSLTATITDVAGNTSAPSSAISYTLDTTAPTVAVTSSDLNVTGGETTATISLTFSEAPSGGAPSVSPDYGTLGSFTQVGTSNVWTATWTAPTNTSGTATFTVGSWSDTAGNAGSTSSADSVDYDTTTANASQYVFVFADSNRDYQAFFDSDGDGEFDPTKDTESAIFGSNVDFANKEVTVDFRGFPTNTAADLSGFNADDAVIIDMNKIGGTKPFGNIATAEGSQNFTLLYSNKYIGTETRGYNSYSSNPDGVASLTIAAKTYLFTRGGGSFSGTSAASKFQSLLNNSAFNSTVSRYSTFPSQVLTYTTPFITAYYYHFLTSINNSTVPSSEFQAYGSGTRQLFTLVYSANTFNVNFSRFDRITSSTPTYGSVSFEKTTIASLYGSFAFFDSNTTIPTAQITVIWPASPIPDPV